MIVSVTGDSHADEIKLLEIENLIRAELDKPETAQPEQVPVAVNRVINALIAERQALTAERNELVAELARVKIMWREDYDLLEEVCRTANSLENELRLLKEKENGQ